MLQKVSEQVAECLRLAAEAEASADTASDLKSKADYQRSADAWRTLAYGYEFQGALERFVSFNESRKGTLPFVPRQAVSSPGSPGPAEAALAAEHASRNDAETVLRNTPFLLTRCSSDLRYIFVSEAYARMLGHRPEELVGKKIAEVIGERAFQTILPHVNAVLAGQRVEYQAEVPYKDIGPRFLRVTYAPDIDQYDCIRGWIASIIDITECRHAEVAVREGDQRLRWLGSIVEFSDDAIISKNLDGVITSWNRGAERVFGYTAGEAIGQPITIVIPQDRRNEECEILDRLRRGEHVENFETIRQRKDGSLIPVSLTTSPLQNDHGEIVGASKILRDITEQKRIQEQIATLAWEAEHRSKNLLANVLATVTLSWADTPKGLRQAIEGRIRAIANVNSVFVETRWIGAELSTIVAQEIAPYSEKKQDTCQPLALIASRLRGAGGLLALRAQSRAASPPRLRMTPSDVLDLKALAAWALKGCCSGQDTRRGSRLPLAIFADCIWRWNPVQVRMRRRRWPTRMSAFERSPITSGNEGRPEGQADRHWRTAEEIVWAQDAEGTNAEGEPAPEQPSDYVTPLATLFRGSSSSGSG
jgi:PAS domain S-box-containing protein